MIPQPTTATAEATPPLRKKIRVHVLCDKTSGLVKINCTHPLPTTNIVARCIRPPYRRLANQYTMYSLSDAISLTRDTIPASEWQNAIAIAIANGELGDKLDATELYERAQGQAFLTIGETMYKLQPLEVKAGSKVLRALRKQVIDRTKGECAAMLDSARHDADAILASAAARLEAARKAEQALKKQTPPPPSWAIDQHVALRFYNGLWEVATVITFAPKVFEIGRGTGGRILTWNATNAPPAAHIVWVPLSKEEKGAYRWTSCHLSQFTAGDLPHMTHDSACMDPAGAPKTITSASDLRLLSNAISQCFQGVSIDSLLTRANRWDSSARAFIPAALANALNQENYIDHCLITKPDSKTNDDKHNEVFVA